MKITLIRLLSILFSVVLLSSCGRAGSPVPPSSTNTVSDHPNSDVASTDNIRRTFILNRLLDAPTITSPNP